MRSYGWQSRFSGLQIQAGKVHYTCIWRGGAMAQQARCILVNDTMSFTMCLFLFPSRAATVRPACWVPCSTAVLDRQRADVWFRRPCTPRECHGALSQGTYCCHLAQTHFTVPKKRLTTPPNTHQQTTGGALFVQPAALVPQPWRPAQSKDLYARRWRLRPRHPRLPPLHQFLLFLCGSPLSVALRTALSCLRHRCPC